MIRRPPIFTLPATLFPYTTVCRSFVLSLSKHRSFLERKRQERPFDKLRANGIGTGSLFPPVVDRRGRRGQFRERARRLFGDGERGDFLVAGFDVERLETLRLRQHLRFEAADEGVIGSRSLVEILADARDVRTHHRSEEHTSELQSLMRISYAVFCL